MSVRFFKYDLGEPWQEDVEVLINDWAEEHANIKEPQSQYTRNPKYMDNPLVRKSFDFALDIIEFTEGLFATKKYVIGQQLLKSGTSIASNSREAQNAESRSDFVHKIKVALKEADETELWLLLCNASRHYPNCEELLDDLTPILKILNSIVTTCKKYDKR